MEYTPDCLAFVRNIDAKRTGSVAANDRVAASKTIGCSGSTTDMTATHAARMGGGAELPYEKGELAVTALTRTKGTARRIGVGPSSSDATSGSRALDDNTI